MKFNGLFQLCFLNLLLAVSCAEAAEPPNILWLSAEDISAHVGCYGDERAITPYIDRLASEGVRYTHAYTTAGVCAPCRSGIITGMYQNSIGTHHMRSSAVLPDWLKPFPMLLRAEGYYCINNSKTDYQFSKPTKKEIWDDCSSKAHWKNRKDSKQPFFAVFNFGGCHESGIANEAKYREVTKNLTDEERQDPAKLDLPPYYPDTPIVREDWKRNYELITAMDAWIGEHLAALKAAGEYENTIIFFWSDHGVGLPRAKRWLYESGTHVPLVIRIPERFREADQGKAGTVDDQLVSSVDFGPTVLNLAGIKPPKHLQGRPFLGASLSGPRVYVFGARDRMDERYDIIRAVRDDRFRYIRNFEPLKPYYQYMNTPEKGATMREIRRLQAAGELPGGTAQFTTATKPVEELYDVENDPHEMHNLASDPKYAKRLAVMRSVLMEWQIEVADIGLIPEAEIELREVAAGSRYGILHSSHIPESSEGTVKRMVEMATLASQGSSALPQLQSGLTSPDANVRYWSATGLGNLGKEASDSKEDLIKALTDKSPNVRIAAARALANLGDTALALRTLESELESQHPWGRLAAAIVLDEMDEQAKPALPALKRALKNQPNKYIIRVANRAVNELEGTNNVVP